MNLLKNLFELQIENIEEENNTDEKQTDLDKCLMALSMYINFYYEKIVSDVQIMELLVSSERVLNKFHSIYSDYTRRQIESIFIAFNFIMVIYSTHYMQSNYSNYTNYSKDFDLD
jgi:hypothetical protein